MEPLKAGAQGQLIHTFNHTMRPAPHGTCIYLDQGYVDNSRQYFRNEVSYFINSAHAINRNETWPTFSKLTPSLYLNLKACCFYSSKLFLANISHNLPQGSSQNGCSHRHHISCGVI